MESLVEFNKASFQKRKIRSPPFMTDFLRISADLKFKLHGKQTLCQKVPNVTETASMFADPVFHATKGRKQFEKDKMEKSILFLLCINS